MKNFSKRVLLTLAGIVIFAAVFLVFGVAVMLLWNWLLPPIFGLPSINYLQAVGLFVLARILFSNVGGGFADNGHRHGRRLFGGDSHHDNPFREKWLNMSNEERKDFWENHHGLFHGRSPGGNAET
jgi:hypothetical protein